MNDQRVWRRVPILAGEYDIEVIIGTDHTIGAAVEVALDTHWQRSVTIRTYYYFFPQAGGMTRIEIETHITGSDFEPVDAGPGLLDFEPLLWRELVDKLTLCGWGVW